MFPSTAWMFTFTFSWMSCKGGAQRENSVYKVLEELKITSPSWPWVTQIPSSSKINFARGQLSYSEAAGKSPQAKSLPKLSLFLDPVLARYDQHRQPGCRRGRQSQFCSQKLWKKVCTSYLQRRQNIVTLIQDCLHDGTPNLIAFLFANTSADLWTESANFSKIRNYLCS